MIAEAIKIRITQLRAIRVQDVREAVRIYLHEFYLKKRFRFDDCKSYYGKMSVPNLLFEAAWLSGETFKLLPYALIFKRYYALFEAMTERAVCSASFNNAHRMQFIRHCCELF